MDSQYEDSKKRTFHVMVPKKVRKSSDADLQVSLVTLKNSISMLTVYASQIERELEKRDVPSSILKAGAQLVIDPDMLEFIENPESTKAF